ncbi:hypothetical protein, partial [Pseudomonas aeruginosa]|uniref:hypothetical protein n=1 Tax=Pseudomonas aeruginosa TaxID=287 RepID=UPI00053EF52F
PLLPKPLRQNTQTTWCCTFPGRQTPGQAERLQALAEVELLQLVDVATVTAGAGRADPAGRIAIVFPSSRIHQVERMQSEWFI